MSLGIEFVLNIFKLTPVSDCIVFVLSVVVMKVSDVLNTSFGSVVVIFVDSVLVGFMLFVGITFIKGVDVVISIALAHFYKNIC